MAETPMPLKKPLHVEPAKRLTPTPETLRELYLLSGNLCAMPQCPTVLITASGVMVGDICHITAAERGGPRFDATMSNEARRDKKNLLLMCKIHHKIVDSEESKYSAKKLRSMKHAHEKRFSEVARTLQRRFEEQFSDATDNIQTSLPRRLARLKKSNPELYEESFVGDVVSEATSYAEKLALVPDEYRTFMLAVINRAKKLGWENDLGSRASAAVDCDDLMAAMSIGVRKLTKLGDGLERYGVGDIVETFDDRHVLRLYDPAEGLRWRDIDRFCETTGITLSEFVFDVKFGHLG